MSYTPGPWTVRYSDSDEFKAYEVFGSRPQEWICECGYGGNAEDCARFIAAAPELLEALKRLMPKPLTGNPSDKVLREFWEYEKSQGRGEAEDVLFAMNTIAKAEGRQ